MLMASACDSYESREFLNKLLDECCPELMDEKECCFREATWQQRIAWIKKFEKVDLGHLPCNTLKSFMCKAFYLMLMDLHLMVIVDIDYEDVLLQKYILCLQDAIALPLAVFNDFYFFPGWEDEFKKTGDLFVTINILCTQLLEAIEQ